MLHLNDDCLSSIFDHLSLHDQIRLTAVNERFRNIILSVQWRSCFRRFESNSEIDALSEEEYHSLLSLIADRIEHVVISCPLWDSYGNMTQDTLRPGPTFYESFEFPVLRVLETHIDRDEADMQQLAAHCPLIERLHLNSMAYLLLEDIVDLCHLRILHSPTSVIMCAADLQEILTALPLSELFFKELWIEDNRSLAEAVIGASDLRILRMCFNGYNTLNLMECMIDLASTTKRLYPLTVYINYVDDDREDEFDEYNEDDEDDVSELSFLKYKRKLQRLIDNQLISPTYIIVISEDFGDIEFRFFHESTKK